MTRLAICKRLGVTPAGLAALARFAAGKRPGGAATVKLMEQGHVREIVSTDDRWRVITESGRAILAEARRLGW